MSDDPFIAIKANLDLHARFERSKLEEAWKLVWSAREALTKIQQIEGSDSGLRLAQLLAENAINYLDERSW